MDELSTIRTQLPDTIEDLSRFVLVGREKLTAMKAEIRAIDKVGLAKDVRAQKLEEAQGIAELVTVAEMQIGAMLQKIPQKQGARTDLTSSSAIEEVATKTKTVDELGFSKDQVSQFQRMAENEEIVEQAITKARKSDDVVSRTAVMNAIKEKDRAKKEEKREQERKENAVKIETLSTPLDAHGLFQTIVIDPPWDWGDEGDVNQFGRAKPDYSTMPIEEIEKLPVNKIADDNCHLYLWVTNRSLPKAFRLIDAWGFRYITCITWVKPSIGMGNYFRGDTEQVLFAIKGSQPLKRHDIGTHFEAPRGKGHSAKPDEFYAIVESCSYEPYIDIFGRKGRKGWTIWGENG